MSRIIKDTIKKREGVKHPTPLVTSLTTALINNIELDRQTITKKYVILSYREKESIVKTKLSALYYSYS